MVLDSKSRQSKSATHEADSERLQRVNDSCFPKGNSDALHTDFLPVEDSLLCWAKCLQSNQSIPSCCDVDPAVQSLWPLPGHCSSWPFSLKASRMSWKIQSILQAMKHFRKTCMCVLLLKLFALFCITCRFMHCWWGWHCIMLQLHGMDQGDGRRRMCAADDKMLCILLLFTAQRVAPRRNLTLPACKLQNPTGINVMSHRFVSMVFDCPTWMFPWSLISLRVCSCGSL